MAAQTSEPSDSLDGTSGVSQVDEITRLASDPDIKAAFERAQEPAPPADDEQPSDDTTTPPPGDSPDAADADALGGDPSHDGVAADASAAADGQAKAWFNAQDVAAAAARGLDEYDLYNFENRTDFQKAMWAADRMQSRRQQQQPAQSAQQASPPGQPAAQSAAKVVPDAEIDSPNLPDGRINVAWFEKNEADEFQLATARALRKSQDEALEREKQFKELSAKHEQQQAANREAELARQIDAFHDAVDAHRPDFYGRSVDEHGNPADERAYSKAMQDRRADLYTECEWLAARIAHEQRAAGLPIAIPSWGALIKQAELKAHGSDIAKHEQAKRAARARHQGTTIRPAAGSVGAGTSRRTAPQRSDDPAVLAKDPDIIAAFQRAQG